MECFVSLAAFANRIWGFYSIKSTIISAIRFFTSFIVNVLNAKIEVWINLNHGILVLRGSLVLPY